ncbi:MAG: hypothetical protein OEY66_08005 [Gammaproteobacteria bacterium]|nr:hypothetical protein [Gammaproteobacteria bacterium]
MMNTDYTNLQQHVQNNCHISDARYAGNYTLCIYLLKMREYYRWEKAYTYNQALSTDEVGDWLTRRENLWDEIENNDYARIELDSRLYDPFDAQTINTKLLPQGLVYSAGIGQKDKPHFFLAQLEREENHHGYQILVSGKEYARDLTSPPAMSQGKTIFIRRESFQRMIWEKIETWRWNKPENAMAAAMRSYDFEHELENSLEAMTNNELESAILHEIGEIKAGEQLQGWGEMMQDISFTPAEIMARAVRDHLADALSTLPALIEQNNQASIHFYFGNLTNMRKHIFPSLQAAYQQWQTSNDISPLKQAVKNSLGHWQNIATLMLSLHNRHQEKCSLHIEALINANHL